MVNITRGPAEQRLNLNSTSETTFLKKISNLYSVNTVKIHLAFFGTIYKNIQSKEVKNALSSFWYT